jgi:hypothetical protein
MVIIVVQNRDSSKRDFANSLNAISDIGIGQSRGETKSKILCLNCVCMHISQKFPALSM